MNVERERSPDDPRAQPPARAAIPFALVGVGNTMVDAGVFATLVTLLGWRTGLLAVAASSVGFLAGAAHSYLWNSRFTFASARHGGGSRVVARFATVALSGLAISAASFAAAHALSSPGSVGLAVAKAVSIGLVTGWDFTLARSWAFRPRRPVAEQE